MIRNFSFSELPYLLQAAGATIGLTLMAMLIGGMAGLFLALGRVSLWPALRTLVSGYIATVQGVPVLILLFMAYYGIGRLGFDIPPILAAAFSLSIYASAYLGDIWRGAIQSVARQQWEASASLALSRSQQYRYIILPQAVRIALPPTVGFLVQLVKNTSVVSIVGVVELARAGQLINNATFQPFQVFVTVAALYFVICYPLSWVSRRLEARFNANRPS
ncbi:MAG: amino acid ABC transporter permease [Devosia sp.]